MDEQKYWRNIIAREIKAEHDRVRKYYSQRAANSGGISAEEQTRLNIFALCQSIVETYNEDISPVSAVAPKPRAAKPRAPKEAPAPAPAPVPEPAPAPTPKPKAPRKPRVSKSPDPQNIQNEFGEFLQ